MHELKELGIIVLQKTACERQPNDDFKLCMNITSKGDKEKH
jgi:hypothetical protein